VSPDRSSDLRTPGPDSDGLAGTRLRALFAGEATGGDGGNAADRSPPIGGTDTDIAKAPPAGGRVRWRLDPGRRAAAVVLVAAAVVAVVIGWRVLADRPRSRALPAAAAVSVDGAPTGRPTATHDESGGSTQSTGLAGSAGSAGSEIVVVDVVGKVRHPGLVRLPAGSRVDDAVRAAGGASPGADLSGLNLARRLVDGEQIAVGVTGAAGGGGATAGPPNSGATAPGGGGPVNLNTASLEQLDSLPGVGPVLAQRIIDWRTAHGRFDSVDQLSQVSGIGAAKFADLRALVTV
jgi:competence protein ComEA